MKSFAPPTRDRNASEVWPILNLEYPVQSCYVFPVTFLPGTDLWSENRRRSKRVKARVPVVVRFQDSNKRFISEATHTVIVNEHGALLLLAASVEVDQIIRLENPNLGEELLCRVTSLGPSFMGKTQVAVELIMPTPGFWDTGSNSKPRDLGESS
jgi:hypothetical protein